MDIEAMRAAARANTEKALKEAEAKRPKRNKPLEEMSLKELILERERLARFIDGLDKGGRS